jgi:hypothetical protein
LGTDIPQIDHDGVKSAAKVSGADRKHEVLWRSITRDAK